MYAYRQVSSYKSSSAYKEEISQGNSEYKRITTGSSTNSVKWSQRELKSQPNLRSQKVSDCGV